MILGRHLRYYLNYIIGGNLYINISRQVHSLEISRKKIMHKLMVFKRDDKNVYSIVFPRVYYIYGTLTSNILFVRILTIVYVTLIDRSDGCKTNQVASNQKNVNCILQN